MKIWTITFVLFFFVVGLAKIYSQTYNRPNVALKSHETLEILKVEIGAQGTVIFLNVENRRDEGGSFCADKNIYLVYPDGGRLNITRAKNIPVCPDTYKFKSVGEKLQFSIEFPPLKQGTKWVDLIEDCTSNCFWFYGVTLDNELNARLDEAFTLASKGEAAGNIILFKNILDSIDSQNLGIEGLLYINIINALAEEAENANINIWYKRMVASHAPRLEKYIKYLNDKGIK
jgi:hypothetical protein